MEHGSKTRLLTAVVIAAVFGAGVLIGYAADSSLEAEPPDAVAVEPDEVVGEEEERRSPIYAQLGPTDEQQAEIDSIIEVHRERTNALDKQTRRQLRQGFREILLETRQAIRQVFPPEQGAEYQRLLDEWDERQAAEREAERQGRDSRK